MNFIILSNQQYDFELKTNKWHIANQMANKGHNVIFVDPPLRFKALVKRNKIIEQKSDNLVIYRPINIFNFKPFSSFNTYVHTKVLNKILKNWNNSERTILYVYHFDFPDLRNLFKSLKHDVSVYDCVDIYSEFPEYAEGKKVQSSSIIALIQKIDDALKIKFNQNGLSLKSWVDDQEKWLCKNVNLVFGSAPGVVDHLQPWTNGIVHYLPNAVEYDVFANVENYTEPEDLKDIPHPRIGFTGAIDTYKNNISLIEKSAEAYPDYHFILIGPEKVSDPDLDLTKLKSMSNVHFLGKKPWEQTPSYFKYFDAYFIPYNLNDYTIGCHPIKYFEGLAAGLPTLITLNSVKAFDVDNLVSENEDQFVKNIKIAIENDSTEKKEKRKAMAREHTWSGKADKILDLIIKIMSDSNKIE